MVGRKSVKWKSLLKNLAVVGVNVAAPGPISGAVNEIFTDKNTNNDEAMQLIAAAMDAMEKRLSAVEKRVGTK
jgi:hypothetical protein